MRAGGVSASRLGSASYTAAQTRVIETALDLFAEHGISGTSLQMIADALGVTKAAVYHQYNTKDEIILAVAEVVLTRLEAAVTAAEAERSRPRAREVLITAMIDLAVERRRMKTVKDLEATVRAKAGAFRSDQREAVAWAYVQAEMLRLHVRRRLSERLDGPDHGPGGSIDKILMTWVEQAVGTAALAVAGSHAVVDADDVALKIYLYSRAQSVMGGTSQIQKNIIATRILGLPAA